MKAHEWDKIEVLILVMLLSIILTDKSEAHLLKPKSKKLFFTMTSTHNKLERLSLVNTYYLANAHG